MNFWNNALAQVFSMLEDADPGTKMVANLSFLIIAELKHSNQLAAKQLQEFERLKSEMTLLRRQFFTAEKLIGVSKQKKSNISQKKARSSKIIKEPKKKKRKISQDDEMSNIKPKPSAVKEVSQSQTSAASFSDPTSFSSEFTDKETKSIPIFNQKKSFPSSTFLDSKYQKPSSKKNLQHFNILNQLSEKDMKNVLEDILTKTSENSVLQSFLKKNSAELNDHLAFHQKPQTSTTFASTSNQQQKQVPTNSSQTQQSSDETIDLTSTSNLRENSQSKKTYTCMLCKRSYKHYQGGILKHLLEIHRLSLDDKSFLNHIKVCEST